MVFDMLHPADQIVMIMERIYGYGMTTTSGGNLSILDEQGDIWITPAGVDKGELTRDDIVCVKQDGAIVGKHQPSSEYPFHKLIYKQRSDLKAVVHAHPPALVAFSIVRQVPDTTILSNVHHFCGKVGMAAYALPGSTELGHNIAEEFAGGNNIVMLENHGVVVGGQDLFEAFMSFETIDFLARIEIKAKQLGTVTALTEEQLIQSHQKQHVHMEEFVPNGHSSDECEIRRMMCQLIHRAYEQMLFTSTQGTFSQRVAGNNFIITPFALDRKYLAPSDLVKIKDGRKEAGKVPSRSVLLHQLIYDKQPHVNCIIIAHPPNMMSFAVTGESFNSRTIPESYILLRDIPKVPFGSTFLQPQIIAETFKPDIPIIIAENDGIIVTGEHLLHAFDRLEVAEYSAKAIISSKVLGHIVHMDDDKIQDINVAFKLP